jgi:hypothetical protein
VVLRAPGARRAAVGVCDIVGTVANRVAEAEQNVVQCACRLVPLRLLEPVGLGCLPRPDLLQRSDLGPQVIEGRIEPCRGVVDLLPDGELDLVEVVLKNWLHDRLLKSRCLRRRFGASGSRPLRVVRAR